MVRIMRCRRCPDAKRDSRHSWRGDWPYRGGAADASAADDRHQRDLYDAEFSKDPYHTARQLLGWRRGWWRRSRHLYRRRNGWKRRANLFWHQCDGMHVADTVIQWRFRRSRWR